MRLYGIKLPELKKENAGEIIRTCRDIHQNEINRRQRNTRAQQWDKYWVAAYNLVLERLERNRK